MVGDGAGVQLSNVIYIVCVEQAEDIHCINTLLHPALTFCQQNQVELGASKTKSGQ